MTPISSSLKAKSLLSWTGWDEYHLTIAVEQVLTVSFSQHRHYNQSRCVRVAGMG